MEKQRWQQIKKNMLNHGWKLVVEIHPNIDGDLKDEIATRHTQEYPKGEYDIKWYHNHMAYKCLFVKVKDKPVDIKAMNEKKHLEHSFYRQSHNYREEVRKQQILKGAEKYPEPFTPDSWSDRDLIDHTMMENVDQGHYIVGLGQRIGTLRGAVNKMHSFHTALKFHLEHGYSKVKGYSPSHPVRINYERTMTMIDNLLEEGESIGRNEDK